MELFNSVKQQLRIKTNQYDEEIQSIIDAAEADMKMAGVDNVSKNDMLYQRAIVLYAKANFGYDDGASTHLKNYRNLRNSMSLSLTYMSSEEA